MKNLGKLTITAAIAAAVMLAVIACSNPAGNGGGNGNGNGNRPIIDSELGRVITCTHNNWGHWTMVDFAGQVTRRHCELPGCSGTYTITFTDGRGRTQVSTIDGLAANLQKEMALIPAGTSLGSVTGTTPIANERAFLMSRTQITRAQWLAVMGVGTVPWFNADTAADPVSNRAASRISWFNALRFANTLSHHRDLEPVYSINALIAGTGFDGLPVAAGQPTTNPALWGAPPIAFSDTPGSDWLRWNAVDYCEDADGYRLPKENQWEFAARAGTRTWFNDGVDPATQDTAGELGWFLHNRFANREYYVARKRPNAWGLFDMHGNVWEWCWDQTTNNRRVRGGAFTYNWTNSASHNRLAYLPNSEMFDQGLRLIRWAD